MKFKQIHITLLRRPLFWVLSLLCLFLVIGGIPRVDLGDTDEDTYVEASEFTGTIKQASSPTFVHINRHPWHRKGHMLVRKRNTLQSTATAAGAEVYKRIGIATAALLLIVPKPRNTLPRPFYYIHLFRCALF